jgi:SagB-type dehydrogenase family enzyme
MKAVVKYFVAAFVAVTSNCVAQDSVRVGTYNTVLETSPSTITLLPPDTSGGKPLMQCLKERKSTRSFDSKPLPRQVLSNLLWAAFGVNRPDGRRTAPSAMNMQEINVYVAMQDGLYLYDAASQSLKQIVKEDIRGNTGTQSFVKDAPLDIVYVADFSKTGHASSDDQILYTAADCGFIAQNVYLFCASEGLACVVRASIDKSTLSKAMSLGPDQKIILSQTVGYPK